MAFTHCFLGAATPSRLPLIRWLVRLIAFVAIAGTPLRSLGAPYAYVIGSPTNIVDLATNTIAAQLKVPSTGPFDYRNMQVSMAFMPDGKRAYVSVQHEIYCDPGVHIATGQCRSATVHALDITTLRFGPPIRLGFTEAAPGQVAVAPDGRFAYIAEGGQSGYNSRTIFVLDTQTDTIVDQRINIPASPRGVNNGRHIVTPDSRFLLVATGDGIYVVDTATRELLGAPIPVSTYGDAVVSHDGRFVYASTCCDSAGQPSIAVIDFGSRSLLRRIPAGLGANGFPANLALSPNGRILAVAGSVAVPVDPFSSKYVTAVSLIDLATETVPAPIQLLDGTIGTNQTGAFTPDSARFYLSLYNSATQSNVLTGINVATRTVLSSQTGPFGLMGVVSPVAQTLPNPAPQPLAFPLSAVWDTFDRARGPLGGGWLGTASSTQNYKIVNQQVTVGRGGRLYNNDNFPLDPYGQYIEEANQEAFVTLRKIAPKSTVQGLLFLGESEFNGATSVPTFARVEVRYDAPAGGVRVVVFSSGTAAGSSYPLVLQRFADGDRFGARVSDNAVVEIYRNDALIGSVTLNATDQAFLRERATTRGGGWIGLHFDAAAKGAVFDDFGGGTTP